MSGTSGTIGKDLEGENFSVRVTDVLSIEVRDRDGRVVWASARETPPAVTLADGQTCALSSAREIDADMFEEDGFRGHRITLAGFGDCDARLELVVALDAASDTLMVRVEEPGGGEAVKEVAHLYRFEKPVSDGGHLVLPWGSGHLIPADCPEEIPGRRWELPQVTELVNFIGHKWTLPMFGVVRDDDAMCVIVDDWWDCWVDAEHRPGDLSVLDFRWAPSLGKLAYPRRMLVHFEKGMDHARMAKLYREHARKQGLVRTLEEKAKETPAIDRYIENILVRWGGWNPETKEQATADLQRFLDMGFGVNFFFPKWPAVGYSEERNLATTANCLWQAYLHPDPVPGGWPAIAEFSRQTKDMGCVIQGFVCPLTQEEDAPQFDPELFQMGADGTRGGSRLSEHNGVERGRAVLDSISSNGLHFDVLYYDGYSAYCGADEDFDPEHPCTRHFGYDVQNQCFAATRKAGIVPGAELARFWSIRDCDYFFFTDWSSDRLTTGEVCGDDGPVGEPVPLFELVFHDCYIAGFSSGGYANYHPGYDWWRDGTPRLYEMMFCSAPAFNWLPTCDVPVKDWDSAEAQARFAWLKRWSAYYRAIAKSEMTAHAFLSGDRKQQRVEFANGVTAEFDMAKDLCRVQGVEGFSGDWEKPAGDLGWYPCLTGEFDGVTWRP